MSDETSASQVPIVGYLQLGDDPHLRASECTDCGARYFDRRNACANCGGTGFSQVRVAGAGVLKAYSVVHNAAPGIQGPFVSAPWRGLTATCAKDFASMGRTRYAVT